jgi:hypothetical protein
VSQAQQVQLVIPAHHRHRQHIEQVQAPRVVEYIQVRAARVQHFQMVHLEQYRKAAVPVAAEVLGDMQKEQVRLKLL